MGLLISCGFIGYASEHVVRCSKPSTFEKKIKWFIQNISYLLYLTTIMLNSTALISCYALHFGILQIHFDRGTCLSSYDIFWPAVQRMLCCIQREVHDTKGWPLVMLQSQVHLQSSVMIDSPTDNVCFPMWHFTTETIEKKSENIKNERRCHGIDILI